MSSNNTAIKFTQRESRRFVHGKGRYIADIRLPGTAHVAFVRSEHPRGRIRAIRCESATRHPEVIAVITGNDFHAVIEPRSEFCFPNRRILPTREVHFQGQEVAAVLATTEEAAEAAAGLVEVEIERLPVAGDLEDAVRADAALVHPEFQSNILVEKVIESGDVAEAMTASVKRVRHTFRTARGIGNPIEGRGVLAAPDPTTSGLNVWISSQIPFLIREKLAQLIGLPPSLLQIIVPDIGGGFGTKNGLTPEEIIVAWLSLKYQMPCRWEETWEEALLTSSHGHEHRYDIEVGLNADGIITFVKAEIFVDMGAFSHWPWSAALEPIQAAGSLLGPYKVSNYYCRSLGVATNKAPIGPLRGVARPSATFAFERMVDKVAIALNEDPVSWRRRNMVQLDDFPYRSASKLVYDKGSYVEALDLLSESFEYCKLREEQKQARAQGRLLGIGIACSLELGGIGSSMPVAPGTGVRPGVEGVTVRIDTNGNVLVASGVPSMGQQPESMFVQLMQKELGVEAESVTVIRDHVAAASFSVGAFAGRGAVIVGGAAAEAAAMLREKLILIASHVLQVAPADLEIKSGIISSRSNYDKKLSIKQLSEIAHLNAHKLPKSIEPGLSVTCFFDPKNGVFANSAHGVLVEVDPELLLVKVLRYFAVVDCGERLNQTAVEGQILGGIVYGASIALAERILYDDDGCLLFPRHRTYPLLRASEIADVNLQFLRTPANSRTGAKPVGQSSTITAPAAIANAVADALVPLGIDVNALPITPDTLLVPPDAKARA